MTGEGANPAPSLFVMKERTRTPVFGVRVRSFMMLLPLTARKAGGMGQVFPQDKASGACGNRERAHRPHGVRHSPAVRCF